MTAPITLETERLLLRPFTLEDLEAFYLLATDPVILRYTGDPGVKSLEEARTVLVERPLADYRKYGYGRLACVHKQTGGVIGFSGLKYLDDLQEVDVGYRFLPAFWGVGLATESAQAVLDDGLTRLNLAHVIGLVDEENVASVRVLRKIGMTYTGKIEYRSRQVARYCITK